MMHGLPPEVCHLVFLFLSHRDIVCCLRLNKWYHEIALRLVDRKAVYPYGEECVLCSRTVPGKVTVDAQRLRIVKLLLHGERSNRLEKLFVTSRDPFCVCERAYETSRSSLINRISLSVLFGLLDRAPNLRHVHFVEPDYVFPRSVCGWVCSWASRVVLPDDVSPDTLAELCNVVLQRREPHLPRLGRLEKLQIRFPKKASVRIDAPINLSLLPRLQTLIVEGDRYTYLRQGFTGFSNSLATCVIKGPLVLSGRCTSFFDRIPTLRYLFCHGTQVTGAVQTSLFDLEFIALHHLNFEIKTFPFPNCNSVRGVSIQAEDSHSAQRVNELTELVRVTIAAVCNTIEMLSLRSGLLWIPGPSAVHAIMRAPQLSYLLLDGCVAFDGRDWILLSKTLTLKRVARVESWLFTGTLMQLLAMQPIPRTSKCFPSSDSQRLLQSTCDCGYIARRAIFRLAGMVTCFDAYSNLLDDPRMSTCDHSVVHAQPSSIQVFEPDHARQRILSLPPPWNSISLIWPGRHDTGDQI